MLAALRGSVCLVSLLCVGSFWAWPAASLADEPTPYSPPEAIYTEPAPAEPLPSCPVAPEAPVPPTPEEESAEGFEPPDAAAVETRLARIEAVEICEATSARSDQVVNRLWWVVAQQVKVEPLVSDLVADLVEVRDLPNCGDPCRVSAPPEAEPIPVHDATATEKEAEGTGELASSVDAGAESDQAALWVIVGLLVGLPICGLIWATVRRGL